MNIQTIKNETLEAYDCSLVVEDSELMLAYEGKNYTIPYDFDDEEDNVDNIASLVISDLKSCNFEIEWLITFYETSVMRANGGILELDSKLNSFAHDEVYLNATCLGEAVLNYFLEYRNAHDFHNYFCIDYVDIGETLLEKQSILISKYNGTCELFAIQSIFNDEIALLNVDC